MRLSAAAAALVLLAAACRPPGAAPQDTVILSTPYAIETFDPHARDWVGPFAVASNFYEPLVTTDPSMALRPALAIRWETPTPTTWVFHLRPGVRFHSGRLLEASDVVETFERLARHPELEMGTYVRGVVSVRALGRQTVEIRTARPIAVFLNRIRFVLIVPGRTAVLPSAEDGTGPYRLEAWDRGTSVRMIRNEKYWGPRPSFRRAVLALDRSPEKAISDLLAGRSDLVQCNSRKLEAAIRVRPDIVVKRHGSIFVTYLSGDVAHPPLADRRVREALELAIDRPRLAAGLPTYSQPLSQVVPAFIFGFDPSRRESPHDPGRARALLSEAGYPSGFVADLPVPPLFSDLAPRVAEMLASIGVTIHIREIPNADYYRLLEDHAPPLFLSKFGCPVGDLGQFLDNEVHTRDRKSRFGMYNDGRWSDPALDAAIAESDEETVPSARRDELREIVGSLSRERPWIPLFSDEDVYAFRRPLAWEPRADSYLLAAEASRAP